jgi:hypothetical protein
MGKDLTSMIEEVNGASSTLTKTNKADEPVRHNLGLVPFLWGFFLLTHLYRSRRLSAFSTHTCPSCRSSTKALRTCSPRLPPPKKQANQSLPVSDTAILTMAWATTTPLMISTAPSCKGGKGVDGF